MFHFRQDAVRRRLTGLVALCVASAALVLGPDAVPTTASAAPAGAALPAVFATGGSGRYVDTIQWLQWADYSQFQGVAKPNVPVLDYGQTKDFVNERDLGDGGTLVTTCTLSNLQHLGHNPATTEAQAKGPLVATIPGAWAGDALDNLYNVGGPGQWSDGSETWHSGLTYPGDYTNKNQMVIGLANGYAYNGANTWDSKVWGSPGSSTDPTGFNAQVSVDYSCSAELRAPDGNIIPVPIQGLVFADAEASSRRYGIKSWATSEYQDEWVQASTDQPVTWRVLDTMRSQGCVSKTTGKQVTTDAEVSNGGQTLRLMPSDEECVYQRAADGTSGTYSHPNGIGGPDVVMFMEGATKATITMQGAGYSAVALGLIVATDFGDAPESYGYAGSLFQPTWKGGEVTATTDAFGVSPQAEMYMDRGAPRLGERIDAEGYQKFSADAQADDTNAIFDDEDSIDLTQWGIVTGPGQSHTERVACEGTGKIAAWIDWNNNGAFDDAEKSNEVACDNASNSATLTWTVPADVTNTKRSVDGEPGSRPDSYMRVRITNDNGGDGQRPVGITSTGEVEDYKVSIRVPTLQLTKGVDNTYASAEVPGLGADQWTVTGTGANDTISGAGTTGDPQAVAAGQVTLSESSDNPDAAGYEAGQWICAETEGTVAETGKPYSSSVGQSTDGAASLTVNNEDRVSCTITNTAKPGSLSWSKVDAQGAELAGSAWALTGPEVPADTVVADCTGASCPAGDYLDQDPAAGRFQLTGLKWGTYAIRETTAPAGYAAASGEFSFTQIRGSALEGTLVPADGVVGNGVVNRALAGSVTWTKVDADNAKPLSGSTWTLTGPGVPADTVVTDCAQAPCSTDPFTDQDPVAGSFKVAALQWSADAYALTEKDPPAGYALDATSHSFTISADALDYAFTASFTNSKTTVPLLPLTGGMGADAFLLTGAALGVVALVAAYVRRRRSQTVQ